MFKGLVAKLAKDVWDGAGTHDTQPAAKAPVQPRAGQPVQSDPETPASVETDIIFPYYPGEGTTCGAECRCRWHVEVRWSDAHHSKATFASWVTTGGDDVCADCQQRSQEWQDVMVRLEPGD